MLKRKTSFKTKFRSIADYKTLTILSLVVFMGCVGGRIYFSSSLAVKNNELKKYYSREKVLKREVSELEFESSSLSCLKSVEERAGNMGFVSMTDSVSLIDTSGSDQFASLNKSTNADLGR